MLPTLLLSAAVAAAAPQNIDARFNQPFQPVDLQLKPLSQRANHPNPAVRAAYVRDEMITNRIRFSRALDHDGERLLARDLQFVSESNERRAKRQVGPQDSSNVPVSSSDDPGRGAQGGAQSQGAPASDIGRVRGGGGRVGVAEALLAGGRRPGGVRSARAGLMDYNKDQGYATPVSVGSPAQEFLVVADTGSQDFVLFDRSCRGCEGHPAFDNTRSSTFQPTSTPMYEAYGTGEASGIWALDRVEMGGYFVNDQPIALVTEGSVAKYMGSELSGIMGLGVPSISLQGPNGPAMKAPSPFWMTVAETVWTDKEFGVFLARTNTDPSSYMISNNMAEITNDNGGVLTLGGLNTSLFVGDMHYMEANTTYWWQLPMEAFMVNGKRFIVDKAPTVIDTGSTAIMMPDDAVRAFHAQIPGSQEPADGQWVIPCDTKATASFFFGGTQYSIQTADILRGAVASDPSYCLSNVGPGAWLLGAAFMKNVYTAFRLDPSPQIGFAQLSPNVVNNGKMGSGADTITTNSGSGSSNKSSATAIGASSVAMALGLVVSLLF